jgi:hypothetical protein
MKITRVILQGEGGEEITLEKAPFNLDCNVGRCLMHGSDGDIVGFCEPCRRFVCSGHWNYEAGRCDECERLTTS